MKYVDDGNERALLVIFRKDEVEQPFRNAIAFKWSDGPTEIAAGLRKMANWCEKLEKMHG
jgi:hypothetical protein